MPTFIPSHRMLTSRRVFLLSVTFLFGVLFLFSSTVISDDSNKDLLFGTHTDITCPANYQSISSTETGTVCQKNAYVCDPTNSLQRSQTALQNRNQFFYAWQCFQYIKGLPLNGKTSCQAIRANTFRNSNCYIIIEHSSITQTIPPTGCSIKGYEKYRCTFPDAQNNKWVPTINISESDPYNPKLIQSSCVPYDSSGRPVRATAIFIETFDTMCNGAKKDGVTFTVTSSYRTMTEQQILYSLYGPTKSLQPAESKHTQGLAVDISSGSWEWLHQIVGCKNTETNTFNYLSKPMSYRIYTNECGTSPRMLPVKRSQLYGLSPLCEDLQTDVQWNNASVIRCSGYQKSGLRYEAWHFELDSTFKITNLVTDYQNPRD